MAAIDDVTGKILWLRNSDLGAAGSLSSWTDSSATGATTNIVGGIAPVIQTGQTPNGAKAVTFAGGYVYFDNAATSNRDGELWLVVKSDLAAASNNGAGWSCSSVTDSNHYAYSGLVYDSTGVNTRYSFTPTMSINAWRIVRIQVSGTSRTFYIDGDLQATNTSVTRSWSTRVNIGGAASFVGQVAEVLAFDRALDTTDATTVEAYLTAELMTAGVQSGSGSGSFAWVGSGSGIAARSGSGSGAFGWVGSGSGSGDVGTVLLSAPSPIGASLASFEVTSTPSEVLLLSAPSPIGGSLRFVPVASPVPAPFNQRPVRRQAHLMEPKSAVNPRKMGDYLRTRAEGDDGYTYPIETADVGMLRVFASGIDVTWLTGAPTTIHDWSFGKPFNCQAASFTIPLREWQEPGVGELSILWADASVEVMLEDTEGNLTSLWDGFTAEETDTAAPGQTGVTWHAEGALYQAAHWPHDPPVIMDPRDVGHVIADAMNSVPNHRYAKVRRFTTGILTEDRGDSSMSVLEYVAGLIGKTFDDDGNQLMFRRDAALSYRLDWCLPVVTPHWTYTKGSPGFVSTLRRPHSSRRDALFGRGFAPDGGFWKGQVFPGLVSGMPPTYPMANPSESMSVGTTDADTVGGMGVTTWQRKMRERGYPVTVDGVMNSADATWVRRVQKDQGLFVDGVLGPQTWAGSWEGGEQTPETLTYRLPLSVKDTARPYDYDASGKILRANPLFDKRAIIYATPEVDAGTNIKKSTAIPLFDKILAREATPGYVGSMTATGVDPWEEGASRFLIAAGDNVVVLGHHGGTVVQLADVTHTPTSTRMTGDSRARGQGVVDAIMARQRDALRSLYAKQSRTTDRGTLNASQLGQYESESPAGKYSRTAINGDHGLWTVRCIYVAEQGLARFRLTTSPRAEIITLILGRRATPNQVASICPDPLDSDAGWYEAEEELRTRFGLVEVIGTPSSPGGYFPKQKGDAGASLTGVQSVGNLSMKSQRGGFFWVASFTSRSTFLEGEFEPEVPL